VFALLLRRRRLPFERYDAFALFTMAAGYADAAFAISLSLMMITPLRLTLMPRFRVFRRLLLILLRYADYRLRCHDYYLRHSGC